MSKKCILNYAKLCDECGKCENLCILDPGKVCDNCFKCLGLDNMEDYATIQITDVISEDRESTSDIILPADESF